MRNRIEQHIKQILRLADQWPTRGEILSDGGGQPTVRVSSSQPHEALPFHLDRVDNSDKARTRDGVTDALLNMWWEWKDATSNRIDMSKAANGASDAYEALCKAMLVALPLLPEDGDALADWEHRLARLAAATLRQTAHGLELTGSPCPDCGKGGLGRPYTSEGLLDLLVCDTCGKHWTPEQLNTLSRAYAKYAEANINVTLKEAEGLLGVPLKTLHARVTRNNVNHAGYKGKRKTYPLNKLR